MSKKEFIQRFVLAFIQSLPADHYIHAGNTIVEQAERAWERIEKRCKS